MCIVPTFLEYAVFARPITPAPNANGSCVDVSSVAAKAASTIYAIVNFVLFKFILFGLPPTSKNRILKPKDYFCITVTIRVPSSFEIISYMHRLEEDNPRSGNT